MSTPGRVGRHNGFIGLNDPMGNAPWHTGSVRISELTDGTSQTVAVAERRITGATDPVNMVASIRQPESLRSYCAGTTGTSRDLLGWQRYCQAVTNPDPGWTVYHGRSWISGWGHVGTTYMQVLKINGRNCHLYGGEGDANILVTPSSQHAGGLNALFGDGTVRFLKSSIANEVWWSIGTRNGGEIISSDSL